MLVSPSFQQMSTNEHGCAEHDQRDFSHAPGPVAVRSVSGTTPGGQHLEVIFRLEVRYLFPSITANKTKSSIPSSVIPFRFGGKPRSRTEFGARLTSEASRLTKTA